MTRTCHILLVLSAISATAHGQGVVLPTAGPINGSMAGASVAAPLDPAGALYWNAATIMGLSGSEVAFGSDFSHPETRVASSLPAGAFGPAVPPVPLSGRSRSSSGVATLPNLAFVHHSDRMPWDWAYSRSAGSARIMRAVPRTPSSSRLPRPVSDSARSQRG